MLPTNNDFSATEEPLWEELPPKFLPFPHESIPKTNFGQGTQAPGFFVEAKVSLSSPYLEAPNCSEANHKVLNTCHSWETATALTLTREKSSQLTGGQGGGRRAEVWWQNGNSLTARPPVGFLRPKGSFGVLEYKTVPHDLGNL